MNSLRQIGFRRNAQQPPARHGQQEGLLLQRCGTSVGAGYLAAVRRFSWPVLGTFIFASALINLSACSALMSDLPQDDAIFEGPIEDLSRAQLASFVAGDEAFGERFVPATGLGPVFNQRACDACHPADGRGHPSTNLTRFGRGDPNDADSFDYLEGLGGPQLQDKAIAGYARETLPAGLSGVSIRGGPVVVGLGLVEAIPDAAILARADPDDTDGDGISGRPNFVPAPQYFQPIYDHYQPRGGLFLGRFGRKATAVTLLHQTVAAYKNDMGITSDFDPTDLYNPDVGAFTGDGVADPEVSAATVHAVVFYLRTLRPPQRRGQDRDDVRAGERLFSELGCAACHLPSFRSGPSPIAALDRKEVPLYSDLLLHDMGSELADGFPEGRATGREWRTTPLWGLGIVENVLGGVPFYLHDGRTSDLSEAVLLHGGEAESARDAFANLSAADRDSLLAFLRSL